MEIAIISGKGGTGKSSISAAFATLSERIVLADCDVDAANLYLVFNPAHEDEESFIGSRHAVVNYDKCTHCGLCAEHCRFDAISVVDGKVHFNEIFCDGCEFCVNICPYEALIMQDNSKSRLISGQFRKGYMAYGRLAPGEENSGRLVNLVRARAKHLSKLHEIPHILLDEPAGIGCPVLSTITGVDKVLIVTEPGLSGLHDLGRCLEICQKQGVKTSVVINKYDINAEQCRNTELFCSQHGVEIAGKVPFDEEIVKAMVHCKSIIEWAPDSAAAKEILHIFAHLIHEG